MSGRRAGKGRGVSIEPTNHIKLKLQRNFQAAWQHGKGLPINFILGHTASQNVHDMLRINWLKHNFCCIFTKNGSIPPILTMPVSKLMHFWEQTLFICIATHNLSTKETLFASILCISKQIEGIESTMRVLIGNIWQWWQCLCSGRFIWITINLLLYVKVACMASRAQSD